jgi:hypothetical protein
VAGLNLEVMTAMRSHYETWWKELGDVGALETISIGADEENPANLNAADWRGPFHAYQAHIRSFLGLDGKPRDMNGFWTVTVEKAGMYQFSLRRWPKETDLALCAGAPPYIPADSTFANLPRPEEPMAYGAWSCAVLGAGKALPIASARIAIDGLEQTCAVAETDKAAVFRLPLSVGTKTLRTWFVDRDGRSLCGALFAEVLRMTEE